MSAWLRWDVVQRWLRSVPDGAEVLEIGSGQGAVAARLARRFALTGVEADAESYAIAVERLAGRGRMVHGDFVDLPSDLLFDVVCAFEVLEHIEDDESALARWVDHLRPGGLLVLSTPMHEHRFGPADRRVGHFRRYSRSGLEARLSNAGLVGVQAAAYGFPLGYALEAARNVIARIRESDEADESETVEERTASSGRWLQPGTGAALLTNLATAPFRILQRPFATTNLGTGLVATGRKPT